MMELRMAYEGNDLAKFERTLHDKRNRITEDPFVMTYLGPLRQRIRESVLLHLCKPYRKITMGFVAEVRTESPSGPLSARPPLCVVHMKLLTRFMVTLWVCSYRVAKEFERYFNRTGVLRREDIDNFGSIVP